MGRGKYEEPVIMPELSPQHTARALRALDLYIRRLESDGFVSPGRAEAIASYREVRGIVAAATRAAIRRNPRVARWFVDIDLEAP